MAKNHVNIGIFVKVNSAETATNRAFADARLPGVSRLDGGHRQSQAAFDAYA